MMTAFNRIGTTYVGAHSGVLEQIARKEWGYLGDYVISGLFNASTLTSYITFCAVAGIGWLLYVQVWEKYAPKYYNTI